jgi:hypothetical protein
VPFHETQTAIFAAGKVFFVNSVYEIDLKLYHFKFFLEILGLLDSCGLVFFFINKFCMCVGCKESCYLWCFYFLFTIVNSNESIGFMYEKSKILEFLDELEHFNDKKVIFDDDEKMFPSVRRLTANFVIRITFFSFNLDTSTFQVKVF